MSAARISVAALCLGAISVVALYSWADRIPDIELRTKPWRTHTGAIEPGFPIGQGFACERDGLRRIDVAVAPTGANNELDRYQLELRRYRTDGLFRQEGTEDVIVLRRAEALVTTVPSGGGFLSFEFEPIPDSADEHYEFEISPAPSTPNARLTAFVIYRGQAQDVRPWGDHVAASDELQGTFVCEHPDLRALAIGIVAMENGPAQFGLWRVDEEPMPFARFTSEPHLSVHNGWVFFPLRELRDGKQTVMHDSRWTTYHYRLMLPRGGRASAGAGGLSMTSYHGSGKVSPRLLGTIIGNEPWDDRDLVFRAWSKGGFARALDLLRERGGLPVAMALCLWIAASIAILSVARTAARSGHG